MSCPLIKSLYHGATMVTFPRILGCTSSLRSQCFNFVVVVVVVVVVLPSSPLQTLVSSPQFSFLFKLDMENWTRTRICFQTQTRLLTWTRRKNMVWVGFFFTREQRWCQPTGHMGQPILFKVFFFLQSQTKMQKIIFSSI